METRSVEVPAGAEAAWAAVAEAAEAWGADWTRRGDAGELVLPVLSGLRRGWLRGTLSILAGGPTSRILLEVGERHDRLHVPAVVVLVLSLAGAVLTVVWPFVPALLPVAPLGALLALGGWFLVVSRLRSSGPEEFLATVASLLAAREPAAEAG